MESAAGTKELERLPRLQGQSTKALLKRSVMVTKLSEMLRDVMPLIDLVGAGSSTTSEARPEQNPHPALCGAHSLLPQVMTGSLHRCGSLRRALFTATGHDRATPSLR